MSYVKIDEKELKNIKNNLDSAIESLTTQFTNITNNIPVRRNLEDPDMLEANNKQGTNYLEIGKTYNNAITNMENTMDENDIISRLRSIRNKINTIIASVDDFNKGNFKEIENEIIEASEALAYLNEYSEIDKVELYTIAEYSAGEKTVEAEDEMPTDPENDNGESGTAIEEKVDETPTDPEETNEEGGFGYTKPDENPADDTLEGGKGGEATDQEEDEKIESEETNGAVGEPINQIEEEKTEPEETNGEGGEATGVLDEPDPEDPLEGINSSGEPEEGEEDENPYQESENNNESGSAGEEKEDEDISGLEDTNNESGEENKKEDNLNKEDAENGEDANPIDNSNEINPIIINNGLGATTDTNTDDGVDDVEIIDGSDGEGIKKLDPEIDLTNPENSPTSDDQNGKNEDNIASITPNGNSGYYYETNDDYSDNSASNGTAEDWINTRTLDLDKDNKNDNQNDEGFGKEEKDDFDDFSYLTKFGQGLTKGENGEYSGENNEFTKKGSTTFVTALLTVLGSIFGLGKSKTSGDISPGNSNNKKQKKGFFENIRNFFKDIFGKNKKGYQGHDHTTIDTSDGDLVDNASSIGAGINKGKTNNKLFDIVVATGSSKHKNDVDRNNDGENGSGKKGYTASDKKQKYNSKLSRYRLIIRTLTVLGIPALIALTIAKIISYLWLIILLIILILLIATFYTMFKDEKEKEEKGKQEKEEKEDLED